MSEFLRFGAGRSRLMFRTAIAALMLGASPLALASAAHAQATIQSTPGGATDPRIKQIMYDPDAIVQIRGQLGYELPIEFDPSERIENVSIGDSLSWQVTPNRKATMLFLKPMQKGNTTSMTVVTNQRIYSFLLTAIEASTRSDPNQMLRLRFIYPEPPAPPPLPPAPPPPPPLQPSDFNFDYKPSGAKQLYPIRVFDDGKITYFQFDTKKDAPAIFSIAPDGGEELAPTRVSGAYYVVDLTAQTFVLRYGKTNAKLVNNGWAKRPAPAPAALPTTRGG
jgi:type IV secretion system protein VirB9